MGAAGEQTRRDGARPLRIALVSDWYLPRRGGIELHLEALANRLAAAGHRVDVITATPGPAARAALGAPNVRVVRLDVPRLPWAEIAYTPALGRSLAALLGATSGGGYDVVHAHASVVSPTAFAAVVAARRLGLPRVVTFHSVLQASAHMFGAADALTRWARGPGVLLTGVSTLVARQIARGVPEARVAVLPNGVDVAWWRAAADPPASPPADEVRFVTAMRLVRKKRPLALIPVAAALRDATPPGVRPRLLVAGDGPEADALARAARRAGLGDVVTLLGWQSRGALRALYREADAFVLPTVHESFGIAALEARAAGLPVLARAGSGVADFVTDGVDGWLCASDADLAARAAVCVRDRAALAALRTAGAERPPDAFGWDAVVARHLDAYATAAAV